MKPQMGLWIDRREAIIITLKDVVEEVKHITSDVKESVSDADAPHVSQQDRHKKRVDAHLSKFYENLTNLFHNADSILIFGPGQAKYDLKKKLEHRGFNENTIAIETTDSMTDAQIVAKVKQHFATCE